MLHIYNGPDMLVDLKETPKTFKITPFTPRGGVCMGCFDELWQGGFVIKKEGRNKHCLKDWGDGTYTIYPNREGIPGLLTKAPETDSIS